MLEILGKGFKAARQRLTGVAELTDDLIEDALRDVRLSLLEGDVEFKVVKRFLERVRESSRGKQVELRAKSKEYGTKSITPEQAFIAICQDELTKMMGPVNTELNFAKSGPTGIMFVGLQGSGKTTSVGKLARWLEKNHNKKPMLVAADIYRPAAVEQLKTLGRQLSMPVWSMEGKDPVTICKEGYSRAAIEGCDVVIFDTAGRLAIDEPLMQELEDINKAVKPANIFLVLDAMTGQDAVHVAETFDKRLNIDGVIMTKLDGDARGGAALSVKEITGKPIKFLGMGESLDKLEEFRPEGLASRILGMGDIEGIIKDFSDVVDQKTAEEDAQRMLQGQFSFDDFVQQIETIQKMGPLQELFEKMPFFSDMLPPDVKLDDRELDKVRAMIGSMTRQERKNAELFKQQPNRVQRVAKGSGHKPEEVAELVAKFMMMRDMMGGIGQQASFLQRLPGAKQLAMARRLREMVKVQGNNGAISSIAQEMLEAAVAGGGPGAMPGMGDPNALMNALMGGGGAPGSRASASPMRQRDVRRQERLARKKNRKK